MSLSLLSSSWTNYAFLGAQFSTDVISARDLNAHLDHAHDIQDAGKVYRMQELIATEQKRYDFMNPNLNSLVDVQPIPFWSWLAEQWA
jgi:hypothetical protein